jgi:hypothetical protein
VPDQGFRVRHRPAGHIDQQPAVGHGRKKSVVDEVPRGVAERDAHHHDVVLRQQPGQLVNAVDGAACVRTGPAGHPRDAGFEGDEPLLDRLAHAAVAHNQDPAVREAGRRLRFPEAFLLVAHEARELPLARQHHGQDELRGGRLVHTRCIREDPARGQ